MKNEPKEIYLFCYDERETNAEYLPKDDDFQSLDAEFVNWGETKNDGCYDVKYVHHSVVDELLEALRGVINIRDLIECKNPVSEQHQGECEAINKAIIKCYHAINRAAE